MGILVPVTMFGWIPFVLLLFMILPPRRAIIAAFMLAWLFLPMAGFKVKALPDYTKVTATIMGVMIGACIFDTDRILSFRPKWVDLPMFVFCFSPFITSVINHINGAGYYDGTSQVVTQLATWGLPYMIGRVYFNDLEGLRELAVGMFIGGLIYVPFCLFEMRMSPQLHVWVYGFRQHSFAQEVRDGGYRPMVFMQHGLMVAMWMSMTALVGVVLWRAKSVRKILDVPMPYLVIPLVVTALMCRSKYAFLLFFIGIGALIGTRWIRTRAGIVLMTLVPPIYIFLRASQIVTGQGMVDLAKQMFGEERAGSLQVRVDSENAISGWALTDFWFGHGSWERVQDDSGKDIVTDSLWIIVIGRAGVIGVAALCAMLLLPILLICWDYRPDLWGHPLVAPAVVLALICMLYMYDHLFNGMVNPIFMLACGGVCGAHYAVPLAAKIPPGGWGGGQRRPRPMRRPPSMFTPQHMRPSRPVGF